MTKSLRRPRKRPTAVKPSAVGLLPISPHIGVISPFALAEAIQGESIPWTGMDAEEGRTLLGEILHVDYESLFSPVKGESPLYPGFPIPKTRARAPLSRGAKAEHRDRSSGSRRSGKAEPDTKTGSGRRTMAKRVYSPIRIIGGNASGKRKKRGVGDAPPCTASVQWQAFDENEWTYPDPPPPFSEADFANPLRHPACPGVCGRLLLRRRPRLPCLDGPDGSHGIPRRNRGIS